MIERDQNEVKKNLLILCRKFIIDNQIEHLEEIHQSDDLIIKSPDLLYEIVQIVGCYDHETGEIK